MKITEIEWGNDSAEKDPFLLKYFVESDSYRRIANLTKEIVIGRKGSGKSALRKKVEEDLRNLPHNVVISICPKYNSIRSILNDTSLQQHFGREMFFQQTWLRQFYMDALCAIGHSTRSTFVSKSEQFARDIALQMNRTSKDFVENISDILAKVKAKVGELGEFGVSIEKELRAIADIDTLEFHVRELAGEGWKFVFTVDDLDLGWDNSETSNELLLGLLSAASLIQGIHGNIRCVVFLREDVYDLLLSKTQHSDKYRNIERIRWTKESLIDVLRSRIRHNYQLNNETISDDPFFRVFPETVGTSNTDNWIVEKTLARPRELIQFSRYYTEQVAESDPDPEILKQSEKDYSGWKLDDLCSEYSNQYPNLISIFSAWKTKFFRHKYHLTKTEAESMCLDLLASVTINDTWFIYLVNRTDVVGFMEILYEIGFIGDFVLGGEGGSRTFYSYAERHEPRFAEVQIHPCFRKAVNTVDRIRTKTEQE